MSLAEQAYDMVTRGVSHSQYSELGLAFRLGLERRRTRRILWLCVPYMAAMTVIAAWGWMR